MSEAKKQLSFTDFVSSRIPITRGQIRELIFKYAREHTDLTSEKTGKKHKYPTDAVIKKSAENMDKAIKKIMIRFINTISEEEIPGNANNKRAQLIKLFETTMEGDLLYRQLANIILARIGENLSADQKNPFVSGTITSYVGSITAELREYAGIDIDPGSEREKDKRAIHDFILKILTRQPIKFEKTGASTKQETTLTEQKAQPIEQKAQPIEQEAQPTEQKAQPIEQKALPLGIQGPEIVSISKETKSEVPSAELKGESFNKDQAVSFLNKLPGYDSWPSFVLDSIIDSLTGAISLARIDNPQILLSAIVILSTLSAGSTQPQKITLNHLIDTAIIAARRNLPRDIYEEILDSSDRISVAKIRDKYANPQTPEGELKRPTTPIVPISAQSGESKEIPGSVQRVKKYLAALNRQVPSLLRANKITPQQVAEFKETKKSINSLNEDADEAEIKRLIGVGRDYRVVERALTVFDRVRQGVQIVGAIGALAAFNEIFRGEPLQPEPLPPPVIPTLELKQIEAPVRPQEITSAPELKQTTTHPPTSSPITTQAPITTTQAPATRPPFTRVTIPPPKLTSQFEPEVERKELQQEIPTGLQLYQPKNILPSYHILDSKPEEIAVDYHEWNMFNFVPVSSEGDGLPISMNKLKRGAYLEEATRYDKAGVYIGNIWGESIEDTERQFFIDAVEEVHPQIHMFPADKFEVDEHGNKLFSNQWNMNYELDQQYDSFTNVEGLNQQINNSVLYGFAF